MPSPRLFFKICTKSAWDDAVRTGSYAGSEHDVRDGFIHFSFAHQLATTAAKYFAAETDLVLVTIDPTRVAGDLRYEAARGGDLFPHLYGALDPSAALAVDALPWRESAHVFPALLG